MQKRQRFVGLSDAERSEIAILRKRTCSLREIAKALGRSPNTISYELKHNSVDGSYDPLKAKQKSRVARRSRRYQQHKIERDAALRIYEDLRGIYEGIYEVYPRTEILFVIYARLLVCLLEMW